MFHFPSFPPHCLCVQQRVTAHDLVPRHPPCALKNLATDARVHCAVLKQRPATHHPTQNRMSSLGPDQKDSLSAAPSDTQQRARHDQPDPVFHAEAVLTKPCSSCRIVNVMLLRKEVIQPHLPVRLPCYDFVPIASPTFDSSLPQGVGPPASGVTDFRDVTGGVYKARERIHRSNADLRLLATPTSWGRVADPNPN